MAQVDSWRTLADGFNGSNSHLILGLKISITPDFLFSLKHLIISKGSKSVVYMGHGELYIFKIFAIYV